MKPASLAVLLVAMLSIVAVAGASPSSAAPGAEIVAKQSARNRAVARRDAERRLGLISLPPGTVPSPGRPSGIGHRLTEPAAVPGGVRHVSEHRFWTFPGSTRHVFRWLHRHSPQGSAANENYGDLIFWEHGPPGTLGATGVVAAVPRSGGGTAVRVDVFDGWEFPRDPTRIVPAGTRYLSLEVAPGSGGLHTEGESVSPVRRISTGRVALVSALAGLINRQPAFQLFDQPSCGPQFDGSKSRLFVFRFKDRRDGKLLAQVSQEAPIGICDAMELRIASGKPYALDGGENVIRRAHDLIGRASPEATHTPAEAAGRLLALFALF